MPETCGLLMACRTLFDGLIYRLRLCRRPQGHINTNIPCIYIYISAGLGSRQGPGCPHTVPPIDRAGTRQLITTPIPGSSTDCSGRGCIRGSSQGAGRGTDIWGSTLCAPRAEQDSNRPHSNASLLIYIYIYIYIYMYIRVYMGICGYM